MFECKRCKKSEKFPKNLPWDPLGLKFLAPYLFLHYKERSDQQKEFQKINSYHYEPLHTFGIRQVRFGEDATQAVSSIANLLTCNYTGMESYMEHNRKGSTVSFSKHCKS